MVVPRTMFELRLPTTMIVVVLQLVAWRSLVYIDGQGQSPHEQVRTLYPHKRDRGYYQYTGSRTPLNPYLSVDGSGYGLWVKFGVKLGFVAAKKYGLWIQEVGLRGFDCIYISRQNVYF